MSALGLIFSCYGPYNLLRLDMDGSTPLQSGVG